MCEIIPFMPGRAKRRLSIPVLECPAFGTGEPTACRSKAKAASLEISPFTVEWVKVTIPIYKRDAALLVSRNQRVIAKLGVDVFLLAGKSLRTQESADVLKYIVAKTGRGPYGKTSPVSFEIERWQWEVIERNAALIDATPEECCRAAIVGRVSQIREFLKEQAEKGGAA